MPPRLLLLLNALLASGVASAGNYTPKFARLEQTADVLDFRTCRMPNYPKASLRNEETGTVTMRMTIAATGVLLDGVVARSSGFRDLDRAALEAMTKCQFRPGTLNGRPVQSIFFMQYVWTLE